MRKILIASIITVFAMLEALAQNPGEFARRVCGVSETDTVAVVPRGVKEIPDYGFYGLSSLRRVELPEGVEKIGRSAFAWCDSLRDVKLLRLRVAPQSDASGQQVIARRAYLQRVSESAGAALHVGSAATVRLLQFHIRAGRGDALPAVCAGCAGDGGRVIP